MRLVAEHLTAETLGWPGRVEGIVQPGERRARALGFPTANLEVGGGAVPGNGVYAGWVGIDGEPAAWPALIYLGSAPTFGPTARRLEAHLFDFSGDLYGRRLHVLFGVRMASERRYASPAALAASIRHLAAATREVLGCRWPGGRA
jgi:riboflavin kinase/FMN adenylyltransferase